MSNYSYYCLDCSAVFVSAAEASSHSLSIDPKGYFHRVNFRDQNKLATANMKRDKEIDFCTASSSKQPRWDLIPRRALLRLIKRFELGEERKTICKFCEVSKADRSTGNPVYDDKCEGNTNNPGEHRWVKRSWNARSENQDCLQDKEFVISRIVHVINHAYVLLDKVMGKMEDDGDDDAAAIAWNGIFLCEATETTKAPTITTESITAEPKGREDK